MDDKIALALTTSFFTFGFFVLLEVIKTAREKKEKNIRALRSILVELNGNDFIYDDGKLSEATFKGFSPIKLSSSVWGEYCGEIILPKKDHEALERAYKGILYFNTCSHSFEKIAEMTERAGESSEFLDKHAENFHQSVISGFSEILADAINAVKNNIDTLEKEKWYLTVLKEILGSSHRIIRMFQDFPNKTSARKN